MLVPFESNFRDRQVLIRCDRFEQFVIFTGKAGIRAGVQGAQARFLFLLGLADLLLLLQTGQCLFILDFLLLVFFFKSFLTDLFDIGNAVAADFPVNRFVTGLRILGAGRLLFSLSCRGSRGCLEGCLFSRGHGDRPVRCLAVLCRLMAAQRDILTVRNFGIGRSRNHQGRHDRYGKPAPM